MQELTNKVYGNLKVLSFANKLNGRYKWNCKCVCGNELIVESNNLKSGHTKSCGCLQKTQLRVNDITNQRFGKLLVISFASKLNYRYKWNCLCDCGNEIIVESYCLKSGKTKSCGCTNKKANNLSSSREYRIWIGMRRRCYDKKLKHYKNYGGRGINVSKEWYNSFNEFYKDMGLCPKGMTLDRIDYNGDYCKENCRWATDKEQARNRRDNHIIEAFGKKQTIAQWSEELNIPWETIHGRLRRNLSIEEVLRRKEK